MEKKQEVGMMIKAMRLSRGLTQAEVARMIHQSPSSITMYETGRREPDFETLEALADIFNVPLSTLIEPQDGKSAIVSTAPWNPDDMGWADHPDETVRIFARGIGRLSPEKRAQLLQVARVMFADDFDEEGNKKT